MPMASSCQVPKRTGVPGPRHPCRAVRVSVFLRQSNFASWLKGQLPGPLGSQDPCGQPRPEHTSVPSQGDPSLQPDTKCKHGSLRCLKIRKNGLAACGVRAHHASVLTPGWRPGSGRQSARLKTYCCAWGQAGATRAGPSDWVQLPALPMQHLF